MGATSEIWLLGIFCLCIIYLCWLLWIPGEGGMWPWVWSEEMFNQNSSPFCDFLKVFQKMRIFLGFKALLVLFFCFAVSGLSLRAAGCCCSLPELSANPPPVALFVLMLSSSGKRGHLSLEQLMSRPFSEAASWALQWESCEGHWSWKKRKPVSFVGAQMCGGTGFASDLCIATWICRSPWTRQRKTAVGLGCRCSAKCRFVAVLVVALSSFLGQPGHGSATFRLPALFFLQVFMVWDFFPSVWQLEQWDLNGCFSSWE